MKVYIAYVPDKQENLHGGKEEGTYMSSSERHFRNNQRLASPLDMRLLNQGRLNLKTDLFQLLRFHILLCMGTLEVFEEPKAENNKPLEIQHRTQTTKRTSFRSNLGCYQWVFKCYNFVS